MPNSSSTPDNLLGTPSSSNIANLLLELNKFQSESLNSRFDSNERSLLSANLVSSHISSRYLINY